MTWDQPSSQEIFLVLFSILYGIMLNSAIGLGAFHFARAFAGQDVKKKKRDAQGQIISIEEEKGSKSRVRLIFGLILLNIFPFLYFGKIFKLVCLIEGIHIVAQSLIIGFLSLGVFAFYRLFLFLIVWRPCGESLIYTKCERHRIMNERSIYEKAKYQIFTMFLYLIPSILLALYAFVLSICGNWHQQCMYYTSMERSSQHACIYLQNPLASPSERSSYSLILTRISEMMRILVSSASFVLLKAISITWNVAWM